MKIIFILILLSLSLGLFFLVVFIWAVKSGQFDDLESPAFRILNEKTKK